MRVGIGHDVHKLVSGRKLILGGVVIPFDKGLLGHSDADVLVHAVCDALLGAAGLGDIGAHFPDTDEKFKDVFSLNFLAMVYEMICKQGYKILNLDSTVFAHSPKLAPYRKAMEENIARTLEIDPNLINVKFTTTEGLGLVGKGHGIVASCIALIDRKN